MEVIFTETELTQACKEWRERLNLTDWRVQVGLCRTKDMHTNGIGEISYLDQSKDAVIRILHPGDHEGRMTFPLPQDMEYTLVHELLHCKLIHWDAADNDLMDTLKEQALNDLARTLVHLKREAQPCSTNADTKPANSAPTAVSP